MPLVHKYDSAGKSMLLMEYGKQKFLGPPECPQKQMEDIHQVEIRDSDVILCSYPKSGCHWLWEMSRMLLAGTANVPAVEKEKYMLEYTPQSQLLKLSDPRIFNTHFLFHQLPKKVQDGKVKILFIYRNPKDVAVSFYNHHVKLPEYEYHGEFKDYLTGLYLNNGTDFGDIFTYTRDWEAVLDSNRDLRVFVVSYEELHADTFGKTKDLAQFLSSTLDDDTIREVVDKCSFNKMLDRKGQEWTEQYGVPVMYRKGKVGDWENWFTVAQSKMIDAICEKKMEGSRFKFQFTL